MDKKAKEKLIELFEDIYHALEYLDVDSELLEQVEYSITDLENALG